MKKAVLIGFVCCLFELCYAIIDCFWKPVNGLLWSTAANWSSNDVPDSLKPGAADVYKAYFLHNWNECILNYDGPTICNLHLDQSKPLRIVSGGHLTVTDWAILSYSTPGGRMSIEGGTLDCMSHLFIGPWSHNYADSVGAAPSSLAVPLSTGQNVLRAMVENNDQTAQYRQTITIQGGQTSTFSVPIYGISAMQTIKLMWLLLIWLTSLGKDSWCCIRPLPMHQTASFAARHLYRLPEAIQLPFGHSIQH